MSKRQTVDAGMAIIASLDVKAVAWKLNKYGYLIRSQYVGRTRNGKLKYTTLMQHRIIMAQKLGRPLLRAETVHHKNGQRADNRLSNLELWSISQPRGQRVKDKIKWAKEFLAQYEPEALRG